MKKLETVIQKLYKLPEDIRRKAIWNAKLNPSYTFNLTYPVLTLKKALFIAFNPATSIEGLSYWCDVYDKIVEERENNQEPNNISCGRQP